VPERSSTTPGPWATSDIAMLTRGRSSTWRYSHDYGVHHVVGASVQSERIEHVGVIEPRALHAAESERSHRQVNVLGDLAGLDERVAHAAIAVLAHELLRSQDEGALRNCTTTGSSEPSKRASAFAVTPAAA